MEQNKIKGSVLDLLRRMPPSDIKEDITLLQRLGEEISALGSNKTASGKNNDVTAAVIEILNEVDQPLEVMTCQETAKDFLICKYNQDGTSYRSPWSNTYFPPLPDTPETIFPSDPLRQMEIVANQLFSLYLRAYYDTGTSSVYFWDLDTGFACAVLLKKQAEFVGSSKGTWDSIHVVDVQPTAKGTTFRYKLTTTVILYSEETSGTTSSSSTLSVSSEMKEDFSKFTLSGAFTRQQESEADITATQTHVVNIGNLVQEMENVLRSSIETVYCGKAVEIASKLWHTEAPTPAMANPLAAIITSHFQRKANVSQ